MKKIRVLCYGDNAPNYMMWRDYWEKIALSDAFKRKDYQIVTEDADIDILLYGNSEDFKRLTASQRFCWIHSHPEEATSQDWGQFEHVWVRSKVFLDKFKDMCPHSSILYGLPTITAFRKRSQNAPIYDIMFIGAATQARIDMLDFLVNKGYKVCSGGGVGEFVTRADWFGQYVPFHRTPDFYNLGKVVIYIDSNTDGPEWGFVSAVPFDVAASSEALCIHEPNPGLRHVFSKMPETEDLRDSLTTTLNYYLTNDVERDQIAQICRVEAMEYTADKAVVHMEKWIK